MDDDTVAVVVTAVLPTYRDQFLAELKQRAKVRFFAGSEHCDPSVRTGVDATTYTRVDNLFFLDRRLFLQQGAHLAGIRASVAVIDLNPRSLTSWIILVTRKLLHRRTLVWGHLHPRSGADSPTAGVRRSMARLADGVITYTWAERHTARESLAKPS